MDLKPSMDVRRGQGKDDKQYSTVRQRSDILDDWQAHDRDRGNCLCIHAMSDRVSRITPVWCSSWMSRDKCQHARNVLCLRQDIQVHLPTSRLCNGFQSIRVGDVLKTRLSSRDNPKLARMKHIDRSMNHLAVDLRNRARNSENEKHRHVSIAVAKDAAPHRPLAECSIYSRKLQPAVPALSLGKIEPRGQSNHKT